MQQYKVLLNSVEKVKDFVNKANTFNGDINIVKDKHIIDGKSIMGLFSIDLTKPLTMQLISKEKNEDKIFINTITDYIP